MAECDLAGLAQLEQCEQGDGLLDAREPIDLGVEVEDPPAREERPKTLEELRDGREAKGHVAERHGRRRHGQHPKRSCEGLGILRCETALGLRRERSRPDAEEAISLAGEPLQEPGRGFLHAPVLGKPARELLGRLLRLELAELRRLVGEERAGLQLEQRGHEHEELPARLEVKLVALRHALHEGEHDRGDVDLAGLELLLEEEREEQVEGTLERVELQLELPTGVGSTRGT